MNESLYKYMKVGLVHYRAYPTTIRDEESIVETIRKLAIDEYFTNIEITTIKDDAARQQVKQMLQTSHMTVAYGAQPRLLTSGLNLNDLNEQRRQEALANVKAGLDEAYEIGATSFA